MTFYDPRPLSNIETNLPIDPQEKVAWVWLPMTERSDIKPYQIATTQNLITLQTTLNPVLVSLAKTNQIAQGKLRKLGGLFDHINGKLDVNRYAMFLAELKAALAVEYPAVKYVFLATIRSEKAKYVDGRVAWAHIEQKIATGPDSSTHYTDVKTLVINVQEVKGDFSKSVQIGLDMKAAPQESKVDRYDEVIMHLWRTFSREKSPVI